MPDAFVCSILKSIQIQAINAISSTMSPSRHRIIHGSIAPSSARINNSYESEPSSSSNHSNGVSD